MLLILRIDMLVHIIIQNRKIIADLSTHFPYVYASYNNHFCIENLELNGLASYNCVRLGRMHTYSRNRKQNEISI